MPRWIPSPETWKGQDAYIIGGGPSLRSFDWGLLRGKNTIGPNGAYLLGPDICKIHIFGDWAWWDKIGRNSLSSFGGICVACCPRFDEQDPEDRPEWILTMERQDQGLSSSKLGFNGNTGSLAVNLALLLGARRVFLLGFDMCLGENKEPNWHNDRHQPGYAGVYSRFLRGFRAVARDLPRVFPGREIVNVSNVSKLEVFPKESLESHFGGRKP